MLKIGITGNIATGKSQVSSILHEKGIPVISADDLVRGMQEPGNVVWAMMREEWKDDFFSRDGSLNRKKIALRIIDDEIFRTRLEEIIHPLVKQEIVKIFSIWESGKKRYAAAEVPLLFEAGWKDLFDRIIVVRAPRKLQVSRIVEKRGVDTDMAVKWVDMQMDQEEKVRQADEVVDTSCDIDSLRDKMEKMIERFKEDAR